MEDIFLSLYLLRFAKESPGKRQMPTEKKSPGAGQGARAGCQPLIGGYAILKAAKKLDLGEALSRLSQFAGRRQVALCSPGIPSLCRAREKTNGSIPSLAQVTFC